MEAKLTARPIHFMPDFSQTEPSLLIKAPAPPMFPVAPSTFVFFIRKKHRMMHPV
ncbi:hypothetical protein SAMN05444955_105239 [Lihuaxuella thermophila]|uniref:Uncharacterized protein n=1 Tax=Lihuaxuella thermophila TaxID=1173111 RepID=A0A1H8DKT8_9BACL|nr:hypothetical protein SAMN05444955_105239 [Lihuaxuella thermophila]